jgi:ABC-type polysaccharide/polyol phosphate transport system ATPase subunit
MRLAFSVAIDVDPDALIIHEALAVGDQNFFAKCFARILEFRRAEVPDP